MLGIIAGGSFFPEGLGVTEKRTMETPFGKPSDHFTIGSLRGTDMAFLPRHGPDRIPPHRINHRANIYALKKMGVDAMSISALTGEGLDELKKMIYKNWVNR